MKEKKMYGPEKIYRFEEPGLPTEYRVSPEAEWPLTPDAEYIRADISAKRIRELEADLARISEELGLPPTIGPAPGWLKRNLGDGIEAVQRARTLELALRILAEAADAYAADQSHATDPRVGLVQPITADEGEALNQALERAWGLLRGNA